MHNKVENTTNNHETSQLCMNQLCQPTLPPLLSSSSKSFSVQNSFCDRTKLAMYFIVPSLFPISLHCWQTGSDGLQTGYWNSLHVSPCSGYCKCTEVQFRVTQREESFLSVFPYLSNSRTLLGGEKGRRGFLNTHRGSWSSLFRDPWTFIDYMHRSNAI